MNHKRERQVLVLMDQLEAVRETLAQLNADELTSVGSINPVFKKRREGFLKAFNTMLYGLNSGMSLLEKLMASVQRPKRGIYRPDDEEVITPRKSARRTKSRGSFQPSRGHLRKLVGGPLDGESITLSDDASSTITFGFKGQYGYYHNNGSGDSLYWEEAIIREEQPMLKGIKGGRK